MESSASSELGVGVLDTGGIVPEGGTGCGAHAAGVFQRAGQDANSEEWSQHVAEGHVEKGRKKKGGAGEREREDETLRQVACDMDDDLKERLLQHRISRQVCWCEYACIQGTVLRVLAVLKSGWI